MHWVLQFRCQGGRRAAGSSAPASGAPQVAYPNGDLLPGPSIFQNQLAGCVVGLCRCAVCSWRRCLALLGQWRYITYHLFTLRSLRVRCILLLGTNTHVSKACQNLHVAAGQDCDLAWASYTPWTCGDCWCGALSHLLGMFGSAVHCKDAVPPVVCARCSCEWFNCRELVLRTDRRPGSESGLLLSQLMWQTEANIAHLKHYIATLG